MADQDGSDGIYSPYTGTRVFDGDTWGTMQVDSSAWQGNISAGNWSWDFNDEYFEAGDRILFFYLAEAFDGTISTNPEFAMATDPELRGYWVVRCLPTAGRTLLFVEDDVALLPFWR